MEPSGHQNNKLFFAGIVCLILCISFTLYSLYILPYLIWNLNYNVPGLVLTLIAYFQEHYYYTESASRFMTFFFFLIPGIISGLFSYFISYQIDNKVLGIMPEKTESEQEAEWHAQQLKRELKESAGLGFKILLLMIGIVILVLFFQNII